MSKNCLKSFRILHKNCKTFSRFKFSCSLARQIANYMLSRLLAQRFELSTEGAPVYTEGTSVSTEGAPVYTEGTSVSTEGASVSTNELAVCIE